MSLKEEFTLRNFGFSNSSPQNFCTSQWNWHPVLYLGLRTLLTVYVTGILIYTLAKDSGGGGKNSTLAFLTIWSYIVLTLHMLLSTCLAIYGQTRKLEQTRPQSASMSSISRLTDLDFSSSHSINYGSKGDSLPTSNNDVKISVPATSSPHQESITVDVRQSIPCLAILSWILSDVISVFALVVTLIYWMALYPSVNTTGASALFVYNDVNVHALNSVFILIEYFVSARPVRLLHFIYPAIYGCIYTLFALFYWLPDKQNHVLYSVLDFNRPPVVVLTVLGLAFIGIPLLQLFYYGLYRFKLFLKRYMSQTG
ncbi:hypothetical protein FSP39_018386 [Pinctada imbricata]|uniref:Protein rolling stone n=1 Tax=Pinctada imbricata TaxID=66713 RepID=A0AA88YDV3_PINIB|nr:hypothetical protein FSP39_018386 [Pinctada imbricata]